MSRTVASPLRPVVVWLLVTGAVAAALASVPPAWGAAASASSTAAVSDLVVATCTTGLALALAWLWLVTTTTVLGLLRGRTTARGATRRLVLVACGVAVVAGTSVPATAAGGDDRELLAGLSLPERAVAPAGPGEARAEPAAERSTSDTYVVRPGDSLSSIALDHPGAGSLEDRWRAIWQVNRAVVGEDPDLILPGQALRLPTHHQQDGDRS